MNEWVCRRRHHRVGTHACISSMQSVSAHAKQLREEREQDAPGGGGRGRSPSLSVPRLMPACAWVRKMGLLSPFKGRRARLAGPFMHCDACT